MTVPFAFANLSGNIALSKLDSNFNTPITIGNTSVQLGNTITTINNVTLANVTITSGTSNVTNVNVTSINVSNLTATLANITTLNATSAFITTGNIATANVGNLTLLNALTVPNGGTGRVTLPVNNVLLGNGTSQVASVAPGNVGNVLTSTGSAWISNAIPQLTNVAPNTAAYILVSANGNLASGRVLTQGANVTITDNGPGNTIVISAAGGGGGNGTGTVTNVSVVSANGFSGTVANSTSNAAITLSATFMGIAWANSTGQLGNVAVGTGLSFSNTTGVLTATGAVANAVTAVTATAPVFSSGGTTPDISFLAPGTAGNVLTSTGSAWISSAGGGGGTPGGSDTQFQYNNGGVFAGTANLTTDGANVTIGSANTFRFANLTSTRYVGFRANAIVASNVTWTLPVSDGSSNQFLKTDGTGSLSWGTAATASPILESAITISQDYTITSGSNGFSVGPVSVATGYAVTVGTGQVWLVSP
jgi:hypothetical protein